MKNFLSLILVVGLLVAGWMNRDKFADLSTQAGETVQEASATLGLSNAAPKRDSPAPTPHPAHEAQRQATAIYPGLAMQNSALNKKFVALYRDAQVTDPGLLSSPDWPLQLADRAMVALGGSPMPRTTANNAAARPAKQVVMYTTSHCPYCTKAKQYLTQKGVRFQEVDIERSSTGKEAYRKLGGNGVPLIMIGDSKVEGFDTKALDRLLL